MIKLIHTADWHLGQVFFGNDRSSEHGHFLDWLASLLHDRQTDALLISGDVFDVANPSAASQRMFYHFLRRISAENPGLQVVIIAGNHDSAARLEAPLPLLEEINVTIKGVLKRTSEGEIDFDDLIIKLDNSEGKAEALCMAVPFLRQGDYPSVETEGNPYDFTSSRHAYSAVPICLCQQRNQYDHTCSCGKGQSRTVCALLW